MSNLEFSRTWDGIATKAVAESPPPQIRLVPLSVVQGSKLISVARSTIYKHLCWTTR